MVLQVGWEAGHAASLACKSNPSVLESLLSPLVYVDMVMTEGDATWRERMLTVADVHFDRRALAKSWLRHAEGNFKQYIMKENRPIRKKYGHVLRPLLGVLYFEQKGVFQDPPHAAEFVGFPPLDLLELVNAVAACGGVPQGVVNVLNGWLCDEVSAYVLNVKGPLYSLCKREIAHICRSKHVQCLSLSLSMRVRERERDRDTEREASASNYAFRIWPIHSTDHVPTRIHGCAWQARKTGMIQDRGGREGVLDGFIKDFIAGIKPVVDAAIRSEAWVCKESSYSVLCKAVIEVCALLEVCGVRLLEVCGDRGVRFA